MLRNAHGSPAMGIGDAAIIQQLQEHVQHVGMSLPGVWREGVCLFAAGPLFWRCERETARKAVASLWFPLVTVSLGLP